MIEGIVIVGIVMSIPITAIITDHKRRMMRLKSEIVHEEIELEKLKQQNFIMETEKMKLELEQMKLDYTTGNEHITKLE